MANENMCFLQSAFRMKIIHSNSIVKSCNYQLFSNDFSAIDCNFISSDFIFVPKQYEFVLITSDQNTIQNKPHSYSLFVIGPMLHDNFQRLSFDEQASSVISDE